MTSAIDQKIKAHVDQFTSQLTELIHEAAMASVQQALANVGLGGAPARAGKKRGRKAGKKVASAKAASATAAPRATKKRASKKKAARRAGGGGDTAALASKVGTVIASKDGVGLGEIAKAVKAKKPAVQRALAMLLDAGTIKKTGEKRGTQYFGK